MSSRIETWRNPNDGTLIGVPVAADETVACSYEAFAMLLALAGFESHVVEIPL